MKSKHHNRGPSPMKAIMLAAGVATLLLTAGCSAPAAAPGAAQSASTGTPSDAPATSAPSAAATTDAASGKGAMGEHKYSDLLVVDKLMLKAGETLHVSGGTLKPGMTVEVYAAQQMTATYNPSTGMWGSASGEVFLTDKVNAVVDAQGRYDVDLVIPAGTPSQTMNIQMIAPEGPSRLFQVTVM